MTTTALPPALTQKSAFIAIIGEPNAGKSTLLNQIAGQKVSIVTHKVQTTRENVKAIFTNSKTQTQLVFTDTPGLFAAERKLEQYIVSNAFKSFHENDVIAVLIDARFGVSEFMERLLKTNKELQKAEAIIAIINKVDLVTPAEIYTHIDRLKEFGIFKDFFAISALKGHRVAELVQYLEGYAQTMPWIYDEEQPTDSPMRKIAEEITREKVFLNLHRELPYSMMVETERWEETEDEIILFQAIYVLKESQKKIVLGKGGSKIKTIGQQARYEIKQMAGKRVHLELFVKVRDNWIDKI